MSHVSPTELTILISTTIPVAVGMVTKLHAPDWVKSITAIALSVLTAVLVQIQADGGDFEWSASLALFATSFASQLASYLGIWKPMGKTDYVPLQKATANFGFGGSSTTIQNQASSTTPDRWEDPELV